PPDPPPRDPAARCPPGRPPPPGGLPPEAGRPRPRCQQPGGGPAATRLEWDLLRVQQGDLGDVHTRLRMTITPDHPDAPLVLEALARGYLKCDRLLDVLEACALRVSRQPDTTWTRQTRGVSLATMSS